jgi:hypothetical protein
MSFSSSAFGKHWWFSMRKLKLAARCTPDIGEQHIVRGYVTHQMIPQLGPRWYGFNALPVSAQHRH